MKTQFSFAALFLLLLTTISGCELVGDIFKAGVWVGVLAVVFVIVMVVWLIGKARR